MRTISFLLTPRVFFPHSAFKESGTFVAFVADEGLPAVAQSRKAQDHVSTMKEPKESLVATALHMQCFQGSFALPCFQREEVRAISALRFRIAVLLIFDAKFSV